MPKKLYESSVQDKRAKKKVRPTSDSQIDFSDIPQSTNNELKRASRVHSIGKTSIKKSPIEP